MCINLEFLWMFDAISHKWVQWTSEISSLVWEEKFHINKQPCTILWILIKHCSYSQTRNITSLLAFATKHSSVFSNASFKASLGSISRFLFLARWQWRWVAEKLEASTPLWPSYTAKNAWLLKPLSKENKISYQDINR